MNCKNHPEKEASGICVYCGKRYCKDCLIEVHGRLFCKDHVHHEFAKQGQSQTVKNNAPKTKAKAATATVQKPKSRFVALLLCYFLGFFGAHYFYVGRFGMGILYLLTLGLFGFGWLFDIIRILFGGFKGSLNHSHK